MGTLALESPVGIMAAPHYFEAFLTGFGVAPSLASQMVADGWQPQNFASIVSAISDFDSSSIWDQLFTEPLNLLQKASLKAGWFSLQNDARGTDTSASSSQPQVASSAVEGSWT